MYVVLQRSHLYNSMREASYTQGSEEVSKAYLSGSHPPCSYYLDGAQSQSPPWCNSALERVLVSCSWMWCPKCNILWYLWSNNSLLIDRIHTHSRDPVISMQHEIPMDLRIISHLDTQLSSNELSNHEIINVSYLHQTYLWGTSTKSLTSNPLAES
jgi:hypothetical protein